MDEEHKEPDASVSARLLSRHCVLFDESAYAIEICSQVRWFRSIPLTLSFHAPNHIQLLMGLGGGRKMFRTLRGILLKLTPSQLPTILLPQSTKTVPPSTSLPSGCMRT